MQKVWKWGSNLFPPQASLISGFILIVKLKGIPRIDALVLLCLNIMTLDMISLRKCNNLLQMMSFSRWSSKLKLWRQCLWQTLMQPSFTLYSNVVKTLFYILWSKLPQPPVWYLSWLCFFAEMSQLATLWPSESADHSARLWGSTSSKWQRPLEPRSSSRSFRCDFEQEGWCWLTCVTVNKENLV